MNHGIIKRIATIKYKESTVSEVFRLVKTILRIKMYTTTKAVGDNMTRIKKWNKISLVLKIIQVSKIKRISLNKCK